MMQLDYRSIQDLKCDNRNQSKYDAGMMLASLFDDEQLNDPFDEV